MRDFWAGKSVALLGGASLIGTHLAKALVERHADVLVADNFSVGKEENLEDLDVTSWKIDLRESRNARMAVSDVEIVFHLASQHGGRGYVAGHAVELWDNFDLDATIFRACSQKKVGKVIFSSSACAYPIDLQDDSSYKFYLSEDMIDYTNIQQPDGPYGTEKLVGEMILDAYIRRGDFQGCSTRSFTVFGPLMNESHAIAALVAKTMIRQEPFEIWGDPNNLQIRNWTYVEDNVQGALLAAEHLERGAINIGVEDRMTPLDAAMAIWEYMGWTPKEIAWCPDKPVGPLNRVSNSGKLFDLGWRPRYSFEKGLRKTVDWYVSTHDVEELRETLERKLTER